MMLLDPCLAFGLSLLCSHLGSDPESEPNWEKIISERRRRDINDKRRELSAPITSFAL